MSWEGGQKTKGSQLWLAAEDVQAFSQALAVASPDIQWQCSHVGKDRAAMHPYADLNSALACPLGEQHGFVAQAGSLLPFGQERTLGLLLFNYVTKYPEEIVPERDFGPVDTSAYPARFLSVSASSLAIRWNTTDQDEALCTAISSQVAQVWKVLNSVTAPVKCHRLVNGVPYKTPRYRIGRHMQALVRREGWCLQDGLFFVLD
ncbi:hypothetical protein [Xanthomonas medicagonis]|uniref:hypothetical protein n=1 Tax=Xanthomonas medicagonis TaxID=3160841 RepID=UPI003518B9A7